MKNLFYIFLVLFVISCDKDSEETSVEEISNVITVLDATGTLAEQTTEEAKKIIFGRWDFSDSTKPGITKNVTCEFDYIEFTDDNYIMGFLIEGQSNAAFGTYELNEDANGFVTSVDLYFNSGESNMVIATLSDVVVTEENNELTSTFTIVLNLSDSDFEICNNLEGSHTTQKEEAMEESDSTDADSNHVLFVNTWTLVSAVQNEEDITSEIYEEPCGEEDILRTVQPLQNYCFLFLLMAPIPLRITEALKVRRLKQILGDGLMTVKLLFMWRLMTIIHRLLLLYR